MAHLALSSPTDMVRIPSRLCVVLTMLALAGCDGRPVVGIETIPFTVAGITIGTEKVAVRNLGRLGSCYQENERVTSCAYTPEKERVLFMGVAVEHIAYEFLDDSSSVNVIKVSTSGSQISALSVRMDWDMDTRCVDDYSADTISKFSREGRFVIERINEMRLWRYGGFSCMSEDGRYISGASHNSGASNTYASSVEMFRLNSQAIEAMNEVFAIHKAIKAQNPALNAAPGS